MRVLFAIAIAGLVLSALVALSVAGVDGGDPNAPVATERAGNVDAGVVAMATDAAAAGAAAAGGPDGGSKAAAAARARRMWRRHGGPDARPAGDASRDGGIPVAPMFARPVPPRPTPPPMPPPPPQPAPVTRPEALAALSEFNTCKKVPPGKRVVKMNLKPDAELADLIAWISSITCKPFVLPGHITAAGKKITIVAPSIMTREEAYASFLNALDSIGLTVERSSGFLKIIETGKAKSSSLPVYGFDGQQAKSKSDE